MARSLWKLSTMFFYASGIYYIAGSQRIESFCHGAKNLRNAFSYGWRPIPMTLSCVMKADCYVGVILRMLNIGWQSVLSILIRYSKTLSQTAVSTLNASTKHSLLVNLLPRLKWCRIR